MFGVFSSVTSFIWKVEWVQLVLSYGKNPFFYKFRSELIEYSGRGGFILGIGIMFEDFQILGSWQLSHTSERARWKLLSQSLFSWIKHWPVCCHGGRYVLNSNEMHCFISTWREVHKESICWGKSKPPLHVPLSALLPSVMTAVKMFISVDCRYTIGPQGQIKLSVFCIWYKMQTIQPI